MRTYSEHRSNRSFKPDCFKRKYIIKRTHEQAHYISMWWACHLIFAPTVRGRAHKGYRPVKRQIGTLYAPWQRQQSSDKGYDGVVISLENLSEISIEGDTAIRAQSGALNSRIASFAKENALAGFEFAAGIPGTIGGAMIMNAGAYGGEMKQITVSVRAITPAGEVKELPAETCDFGYRTSALKREGYVVLSALLQLKKGDEKEITDLMTELALKRKEKQPLEYPSAGSTFKRPEGYFAGKLIEDAGLRGFSVGDAAVSEKHCGFVINKGQATAADIYALIKEVQKRVLEDSGVGLEPEVILVGDFE